MANPDKGYEIEWLGTCKTNATPGSQHTATVECWHLWSYAQEAALIAMGEKDDGTFCYKFVQDAERRARRIAANYADLYFRSKEKSQNRIQFYWVALAAFVVKDVAYAFEYTRSEVLDGWRGEWGDAFGQDAYLHAMRTYLALAKGNLWLFMDIYPWYWFYLEYVINDDGSLNTGRLELCTPKRDSDTYQKQSKEALQWLPYSRNWLQRAAGKIASDSAYTEAARRNDTYAKIGKTSDKAHVYVKHEIARRKDQHDVPDSRYWPRFKEAFDILDAERKEMLRIASDGSAIARLEKVAKFRMTEQVREAYQHISRGIEKGSDYQQKELVVVAEQEQKNILQPLIYDDSKLKETLDLNHAYSRRSSYLSPPFKVVFSHAKDSDDPELKVQFDPPEGVLDWIEGSNRSLANIDDRMGFVQKIADRFNRLMSDKIRKPQLESDLQKIRGWLHA
jgi:hypothetical protein